MKDAVEYFGDMLAWFLAALIILYAPFARSFIKALGFVLMAAVCWSCVRVAPIFAFNEECPPLVGFLVVPIFALVYASMAKAVKTLLFAIPYFARVEASYKKWLAERGSNRSEE